MCVCLIAHVLGVCVDVEEVCVVVGMFLSVLPLEGMCVFGCCVPWRCVCIWLLCSLEMCSVVCVALKVGRVLAAVFFLPVLQDFYGIAVLS